MTSFKIKCLLAATAVATTFTSTAYAGGLADAITEREPEIVEQAAPAAVPGWVVPAVALLLIGVAVAASSDSGSDDDDPTPEAQESNAEPEFTDEELDNIEFDK